MKMTADEISARNDKIRKELSGAYIVASHNVSALHPEKFNAVIQAVRDFDSFDADDDPYGEHDFGAFDLFGRKYFWKIDDHAPDGSYPVLTIMEASEY